MMTERFQTKGARQDLLIALLAPCTILLKHVSVKSRSKHKMYALSNLLHLHMCCVITINLQYTFAEKLLAVVIRGFIRVSYVSKMLSQDKQFLPNF